MAKTVASRKQKGMRLQHHIINTLLKTFEQYLTENDLRSIPSSVPGPDIWMSEKAISILGNIDIEAKNQEKLNIWNALAQLEKRSPTKDQVVVFSRNHSPTYACVKLEYLLSLLLIKRTLTDILERKCE